MSIIFIYTFQFSQRSMRPSPAKYKKPRYFTEYDEQVRGSDAKGDKNTLGELSESRVKLCLPIIQASQRCNKEQSLICMQHRKHTSNKENHAQGRGKYSRAKQPQIARPKLCPQTSKQMHANNILISQKSQLVALDDHASTLLIKNKHKQNKNVQRFIKGKYVMKACETLFSIMSKEQLKHLKGDLQQINEIYSKAVKLTDVCIFEGFYLSMKTNLSRLVFFLGLEIDQTIKKEYLGDYWTTKITRCLHFQIYYSLLLEVPEIAMSCLIECARVQSNQKLFDRSQYFCEMALKLAIFYGSKFYEEAALQQIGICYYKMGNIERAAQIHKNIEKISNWSRKQFLKFYNQDAYLLILKQHLLGNSELNTKRMVSLIETIVFDKVEQQENEATFKKNKSNDRLLISKTNKGINQFRILQQKLNDMRKVSNQTAIKTIRYKNLHQFDAKKQNNEVDLREEQMKRKFEEFRANSGLLRCHQSLNRSQDKNSEKSPIHVQRNVKGFFLFLDALDQALDSVLNKNQ